MAIGDPYKEDCAWLRSDPPEVDLSDFVTVDDGDSKIIYSRANGNAWISSDISFDRGTVL